MLLLLISFCAGVLTVFAPCILPVLPVILGTTAAERTPYTPYIVVLSLAVSIFVFTYVLKVSTLFVDVPPEAWAYLSGGIILFFGVTLVFPQLWERARQHVAFVSKSDRLLRVGVRKKSAWGDVLVGAALGPVFSSCSPTYFVILASVLPVSLALGTFYLLLYILGLSLMLLLIAFLGQRFIRYMQFALDPYGWFKRSLGLLFILTAVFVGTGYDKKVQLWILENGFIDVVEWEEHLLERLL